MRVHHKKESGFSAVEVLVVIVILVIVGAVGFFAFKAFNKQNASTVSQPTASSPMSDNKQDFSDVDTSAGYIDYQYRPGPVLRTASDTDLLKGAPAGFVAFLKEKLNGPDAKVDTSIEACAESPYEIMVAKVDQKFALGSTGSCGAGAKNIWGEVDGKWQELTGGNGSGMSCTDLYKYAVSKFIAGDTCVNYQTHQTELYQPK